MRHRIGMIWQYLLIGCLLSMTGCKSSHEDLVQEELNSGKVNDSLWYGIEFKMTRTEFEEEIFKMNQKGLFMESALGLIDIKFPDRFKYPVRCEFYPEFNNEVIVGMSGRFSYLYWNGFNRNYDNIVLLQELLPKFEIWFKGNGFIEMETNEPANKVGPVYVKIDGNRELKVWNDINLEHVYFSFKDLTKQSK